MEVDFQGGAPGESGIANRAFIWSLVVVNFNMVLEMSVGLKSHVTSIVVALEGFLSCVDSDVSF
jgi:hypothetical protein